MNPRIPLLFSCLFIALPALVSPRAQTSSSPRNALSLLPSSMVFLGKYPNIEKTMTAFKANPVYKLYCDEERGKALERMVRSFKRQSYLMRGRRNWEQVILFLEKAGLAEKALGNLINKFQQAWIAIGRPALEDMGPNPMVSLGTLLVLEFEEGKRSVGERFVKDLRENLGKVMEVNERSMVWRGMNVTEWRLRGPREINVYFASMGRFLVFSFFTPWTLYESIDAYQGASPSLEGESWAQAVAREKGKVSAGFTLSEFPLNLIPNPYGLLLSNLGFSPPRWARFVWDPGTGSYFIELKDAAKRGVLKDLAGSFSPGELANLVPGDISFYAEFPLNWKITKGWLKPMFAALRENGFFRGKLQKLEEKLALFSKKYIDVNGFMEGAQGIAISLRNTSLLIPEVELIIKASDEAVKLFYDFARKMEEKGRAKIRKRYGIDVITLKLDPTLLFACKNNVILFLPKPGTARNFLPCFAGKMPGLSQSRRFRAAVDGLGKNYLSFFYVDGVEVVQSLESLMGLASTFLASGLKDYSISELFHDRDELEHILKGYITGIKIKGNDIIIGSNSPFSMVNIVATMKLGLFKAKRIMEETPGKF